MSSLGEPGAVSTLGQGQGLWGSGAAWLDLEAKLEVRGRRRKKDGGSAHAEGWSLLLLGS